MKQGKVIQRELHTIQNAYVSEVKIAVREYLDLMRKDIKLALLERFVKDVSDDIIDWKLLENKGSLTFKKLFLKIIGEAGKKVYNIQLKKQIGVGYDIVNVEAVEIADKITNELVVGITQQAKQNLQYIIKSGVEEGKTMYKVAKEIRREHLGITMKDYKAAEKYTGEAKEKYIRKKYRKRCDVIARTETSRATSEGSINGYNKRGIKRLVYIASANACEICADLDGTIYPVPKARGVLPRHPNCRCTFAPARNI